MLNKCKYFVSQSVTCNVDKFPNGVGGTGGNQPSSDTSSNPGDRLEPHSVVLIRGGSGACGDGGDGGTGGDGGSDGGGGGSDSVSGRLIFPGGFLSVK